MQGRNALKQKQKNEGAKMNPDDNKNDNAVNGSAPQVPGTESPVLTPTIETPASTGVSGFDATGDAPGDSSSQGSTPPTPDQFAGPELSSSPDPSAGLPGSVTPAAPSDPVVTPTIQNPGMDQQDTPVTPAPVETPQAEHSKTLVVVLVVVVVLMAAVAGAYFAGLFG
jgi:hypothetical protein